MSFWPPRVPNAVLSIWGPQNESSAVRLTCWNLLVSFTQRVHLKFYQWQAFFFFYKEVPSPNVFPGILMWACIWINKSSCRHLTYRSLFAIPSIFYRPRERKNLSCGLYTLSGGQSLIPVGEQQGAPILTLGSVKSRYAPPASILWARCVYPLKKKNNLEAELNSGWLYFCALGFAGGLFSARCFAVYFVHTKSKDKILQNLSDRRDCALKGLFVFKIGLFENFWFRV